MNTLRNIVAQLMVIASLGFALFCEANAQPLPPATEWVPENAAITVEIPDSSKVVHAVMSEQIYQWIKKLPQGASFLQSPQFAQAMGIVKYLEYRLSTDWQTAVDKLLGGSIFLAAFPGETFLAIFDTKSAELLQKLHAVVFEHAQEEARKLGDPTQVASKTYKGWTGWTLDGGKTAYTLADSRLIWTTKPDLLRSIVDISESGGTQSLARQEAYRQALAALPSDAIVRLFVNMQLLRQPLGSNRLAESLRGNPLGALLVGDLMEPLKASTWIAGSLQFREQQPTIELLTDGVFPQADHPTAFSLPDENLGCFVNVEVPRRILAISLYRDLSRFYAAKDLIFPERTSGLIFFENMMGIFFTGRHFSQEVLPHLAPEIRIVVAAQDYDPQYGVPVVTIPGIALIFRMKDPERFVPMAEEAWQKALGLINFTRGQQALPGLIMDRQEYQGVRYFVASFSTAGLSEAERSDVRFNFRPALAAYGNNLILSTTEQLARDLIGFLRDTTRAEARLPGRNLVAELDREALLRILEVNYETLVRQNMVEKGHGRDKAEEEVAGLLLLVKLLGQQRLEVMRVNNGPRVRLTIGLPL